MYFFLSFLFPSRARVCVCDDFPLLLAYYVHQLIECAFNLMPNKILFLSSSFEVQLEHVALPRVRRNPPGMQYLLLLPIPPHIPLVVCIRRDPLRGLIRTHRSPQSVFPKQRDVGYSRGKLGLDRSLGGALRRDLAGAQAALAVLLWVE